MQADSATPRSIERTAGRILDAMTSREFGDPRSAGPKILGERAGAEPISGPDGVDARRLENAVWRLWRKERSQSDVSDAVEVDDDFLAKVQNAIGHRISFSDIRYQVSSLQCEYDDLPTFPIRPNFANFKNQLRPASECVVFDGCPDDPYHPSNTPIYQTATFVQPSASEFGAYDYTRSGNPTRTALEKHVAMLEQAAAAFAFASGMAALHTVTRLLRMGDEVLCNEDIYGGMHRLLTQDCVHNGVKVTFVDTTDVNAVRKAITPNTKMIHLESPSNPCMRITDLSAIVAVAHERKVLVTVDSTMMPPVICKPLTLGVDIVVHSATKFFSGHADCTGGLVCVRDPELAHRVAFLQNCEGTALAPFECFLFLRGMKTMFLRVQRAQENAVQVCNFLRKHPLIKQVLFPGAGGCDSKSLAIHRSQSTGPGAVMSFTTGDVELSRKLIDACKIFKTTVSFGSVNSLCEMPCTMSHASIPSEKRSLPADLVRLSIGIEDPRDLLVDLAQALEVASGNKQLLKFQPYDSRFEDLPVVPQPSPDLRPLALPTSAATEVSTKVPSSRGLQGSDAESSSQGSCAGEPMPGCGKAAAAVPAALAAQLPAAAGGFALAMVLMGLVTWGTSLRRQTVR
mmetsp:Transcript_109092/g.304989  ORF Transcript_109092/g.304989 Transcript_109092/m.304989 type:complete len:627 (+) Transcript_109092:43-1923(+)